MQKKRRIGIAEIASAKFSNVSKEPHKPQIPIGLAKKLLWILNTKMKALPLKNKIGIDISLRNVKLGKKREISKKRFDMAFKLEYKHILDAINISWGERKYLRNFIIGSMEKIYYVL